MRVRVRSFVAVVVIVGKDCNISAVFALLDHRVLKFWYRLVDFARELVNQNLFIWLDVHKLVSRTQGRERLGELCMLDPIHCFLEFALGLCLFITGRSLG